MDRNPRISLHLVRGFWAAARHLSFTQAAAELFVTQSAISREVKKLEEQLGQPLFHRVNRSLRLTPAGEELFHAVDEALALIDAATARLAGPQGGVAVTTTIPLASLWLVPRLPRFTRRHPDIDVQIAASNDVLDLPQSRIDIAIRHVRSGHEPAHGNRLMGYSIFPVCAPALLNDQARPLRTLADLAQHALLEFETTVNGRPWYDWEEWFRAVKAPRFRPAQRQRFSHYDQVVEAALAGCGVAIGKRPHLDARLREGALCAPFGSTGVAELGSFYLQVSDTARDNPAVKAFIGWLRREARRDTRPTPAAHRR